MKISRYETAGLKCIEVAPDNAEGRDLPLIVCLHGRGDWGESYVDIAPALSETAYRFVFPTGSLALPGAMFEWFRLEAMNLGPGAAKARVQIMALLDELGRRYNTPASRTILGGFSQGGMMTLDAGLRYPQKLAGLFALSCFMVADAPFNWSNPTPNGYYGNDRGDLGSTLATAAMLKTPVFLAHGTYDPVVPLMAGRATRDLLQKAGVAVEYYEFPGAHQISMDELAKIKEFLAKNLTG